VKRFACLLVLLAGGCTPVELEIAHALHVIVLALGGPWV
jgi:hypothetical protein